MSASETKLTIFRNDETVEKAAETQLSAKVKLGRDLCAARHVGHVASANSPLCKLRTNARALHLRWSSSEVHWVAYTWHSASAASRDSFAVNVKAMLEACAISICHDCEGVTYAAGEF